MAALFSADLRERLRAVRALDDEDRLAVLRSLGRGCPVPLWPYGMPFSVNPGIVVLGASPGASPAPGDMWLTGTPLAPTFGAPHPGLHYPDGRGFWDRVRGLMRGVLRAEGIGDDADADALSGVLNLDDGQYGQAAAVPFRQDLADWVAELAFNRLHPAVIVALGLTGGPARQVLAEAVRRATGRVMGQVPDRERDFSGHVGRTLRYRVWQVPKRGGRTVPLVLWPQHPSRAPFTNGETWRAACAEFVAWWRDGLDGLRPA